jgi:hypothetical protein
MSVRHEIAASRLLAPRDDFVYSVQPPPSAFTSLTIEA